MFLRVLPVLLVAIVVGCASSPDGPPNVVLITLESLRTDHVTVIDGKRPTTPSLSTYTCQ